MNECRILRFSELEKQQARQVIDLAPHAFDADNLGNPEGFERWLRFYFTGLHAAHSTERYERNAGTGFAALTPQGDVRGNTMARDFMKEFGQDHDLWKVATGQVDLSPKKRFIFTASSCERTCAHRNRRTS